MLNDKSKIEVVLPTNDLSEDLDFFSKTLGMHLESIFPADDPTHAILMGHGFRLCLDRKAEGPPPACKF